MATLQCQKRRALQEFTIAEDMVSMTGAPGVAAGYTTILEETYF